MRICLIAEGSYPYVLGGVSSWVNTIIRSYPEHEFIIYSISTEASKKGEYKYDIPKNVVEIVDVFLDEIELVKYKTGKKYSIEKNQEEALQNLFSGNDVEWENIFKFFSSGKIKSIGEFFMSKNFYGLIEKTYKEKYQYTPFTEFIWNVRSMYLTLFYLLSKKPPKADIYHSICTGYAGVIASYGKYLYDSPFILSEHGIYTREREEEIIKSTWIKPYHKEMWTKYFNNLSNCAYRYSDIVTSLFMQNKNLQVEFGCDEEKIKLIPNGVEIRDYENLPSKEDSSVINIGSIARIVPIKDIKTMLLSFNIVKRNVPNSKFYIMGPIDEDEEYYNECLDLVKDLDIKDVVFTGTVKVSEYINKMDVLVLTSISEGQPLAVMEAMATKKSLVCTDVGHCRGLLYGDGDNYGQCGFIEAVTDYEGIAKSITKLAIDEELRNDMGKNGYERVRNIYTKELMISSYRDMYYQYERI